MCLMRPRIENEVEFVDRRPARKVYVAAPRSPRRSTTRTRISDTVIIAEPPAAQYVQAPAPAPVPKPAPPKASVPKIVMAPTPPPPVSPTPQVELVEVEEATIVNPKASRSSVSGRRRRSHASEEREVYIERERERIRGLGKRDSPPMDAYRYVEGTPRRERSRSITYETNPRHSGRLIERERVVVEDSGRRREFYQRR